MSTRIHLKKKELKKFKSKKSTVRQNRTHTAPRKRQPTNQPLLQVHQCNLRRALCAVFFLVFVFSSFNWTFNTLNVMVNLVKHFIWMLWSSYCICMWTCLRAWKCKYTTATRIFFIVVVVVLYCVLNLVAIRYAYMKNSRSLFSKNQIMLINIGTLTRIKRTKKNAD